MAARRPSRSAAPTRWPALAAQLDDRSPGDFDVRFGSKYEPPLLETTAEAFRAEGFDDGHRSRPRAALVVDVDGPVHVARRARPSATTSTSFAIGAWWEFPGFLEIIAARVNDALSTIPDERRGTTEVIFSAHSLPEKILASGDTYPEQLRESAERAAALAGVERWDVAWQSAGRTPDPWIGPDILQVLREKRAAGLTDVVSCPIGFVSDHLEVLFDIDIEAQGVAREIGLHLVRTASLNDDPAFMALLANVVLDAVA